MAVQKRKTPAGIRYIARVRDSEGKERSKSFKLRREAVAWESKQQLKRTDPPKKPKSGSNLTVADIMDERAKDFARSSTRASILAAKSALTYHLGTKADKLTPSEVQQWVGYLTMGRPWAGGAKLTYGTVRLYLGALSTAYKKQIALGNLKSNPCEGVTIPKVEAKRRVDRIDLPTLEQVEHVASLCPLELGEMLILSAHTGLRVAEVCALRDSDINFATGMISVRHQLIRGKLCPPKTESSRRDVPIPARMELPLKRKVRRGGFIFSPGEGKPYSREYVGVKVNRKIKECGYMWSYHATRHLFASILIDSGASIKAVQTPLGHSTPSVTLDVYSHLISSEGSYLKGITSRAFAGYSRDEHKSDTA